MANVEELKEAELTQLTEEYNEIAELERLIVDGANAKIPYIINYPRYDEEKAEIVYTELAVKLSPVTSAEWNNATGIIGQDRSDMTIKIVSKGLYTKSGDEFPLKLIRLMPTGVINTLFKEIAKLSGVELNTKENMELMKNLMGF